MSTLSIAAVIAAAGQSRRMGEPKQLLPWGESTVIGAVVNHLLAAGAAPVLCITGHQQHAIAAALTGLTVQLVYNPHYADTEMLTSYQTGLRTLVEGSYSGALLALGDQPHLPVSVLTTLIAQINQTPEQIVIPSYNNRRGHPIYLPRRLWAELLALTTEESLRTLINRHTDAIVYCLVDTPAVLRDMDTPAEYQALRNEESIG